MFVATLCNGSGMEILDPHFRPVGMLALKIVFRIPPATRESLFFGSSKVCTILQKIMVRTLGGAFMVQIRFTEGLLTGQRFACWTSEKYFFLGSRVENDIGIAIRENTRQGDVVYDVGAHAGYTSLIFSNLVGANGRVFSFEPSPANYARICGNMRQNRKENVNVIDAAVSDHEGCAFLAECGSMSAIVSDEHHRGSVLSEVRLIRLDDFVYRDANPPPALVKIDIEGHAGAAFKGMREIFKSARPVVLCELHDSEEETQVSEILLASGYRILPVDHRGGYYPWHVLAQPR
jgi:FkbM family methyltransferase